MNEEPNQVNKSEEQNDVNNSGTSPISKARDVGGKAINGVKKTAKYTRKAANLAKKAVKAVSKAIQAGIKLIVTNPVAAIIIAIIFFLLVIVSVLIKDLKWGHVTTSVNNGAESVIGSWDSSNLTEQQKAAKESYEKTGSLLNFSLSDQKAMVDALETEYNSDNLISDYKKISASLLTKVGTNEVSGSRIVSPDDNVTLYEHILSIAKYDFNNVKWNHYGHGYNGEASPLKDDYDMGVKYPSDQNNTKFETFSSLLRPYLLSHEIPIAFFSGLIDNTTNELKQDVNFTYSLIKYGLSDIEVNRYDVQTYNLATYYREYDAIDAYSSFSVTITPNSDGSYGVSFSNLRQHESDEVRHVNTRKDENGNDNVMLEEVIPDRTVTSIDNVYYISKAYILDQKINDEYRYVQYSQSDANSRINADSEVYEDEYYEEIAYEENYMERLPGAYSTVGVSNIDAVVDGIESRYNATGQLVSTQNPNGSVTYSFRCDNYEKREGTTTYVTRVWSDTLSQSESNSELYTTEDVLEYNKNNSAGAISEEEFNSDEESVEYYNNIEENEKLNRIDFINSNPNIYKLYISGSSYAKYVGIGRNDLELFCYNNLIESWNTLVDDYGSFPYAYGSTYGFKTQGGSSSSSISGINLLRMYIHTFEGDGSSAGGGRFDENHSQVYDDRKTKYYKVYDAGDGVHTVGYGVNMEAQRDLFAEYGIDVSTVSYGDYIESAIVDKIENIKIQQFLDNVKSVTNGLELQEYQLHALTSHCYVAGNINGFVENYNLYWNQDTDDKYEELYEKYKDSPESSTAIMGEVNFEHKLYTSWFNHYNNNSPDGGGRFPGWIKRERSEFTLFSTGYYSTLKMFWGNSGGTPNGIVLTNGDEIDDAACLELQTWFEDNVFGGKIHAGTNLRKWQKVQATDIDDTDSRGIVNPEYSALATGSFPFECPWWSRLRANMYLRDMGSDLRLTGRTGDGREAAQVAYDFLKNSYNVTLNSSIDGIQPYSIISFDKAGSGHGHTAFVEAVTSEYIIISQCSGPRYWNGVSIVSKSQLTDRSSDYYFVNSICLADVL